MKTEVHYIGGLTHEYLEWSSPCLEIWNIPYWSVGIKGLIGRRWDTGNVVIALLFGVLVFRI